ncbi:MAG: DinB family protein, partial [Candidatus Eisenbacteria bacterium]
MDSLKEAMNGKFEYFRMVLGMTRKMVEQWPDDRIDFRPVPEARSAGEILAHMYGFLVEGAATAKSGVHEKQPEPTLETKGEALAFMDRQTVRFFEIWGQITDEDLGRTVEAYGTSFPASQFLDFTYAEHWHHRGQFTVYLRLRGVAPVMIYDYGQLQG